MKMKLISLLTTVAIMVFVACNNDGAGNASNDTGTATTDNNTAATDKNRMTTTKTSTQDYTALADTFQANSKAGYYLDPRTGKSIHIAIDPNTGIRYNAETNEPVWRYIDKRTWWVYSGDNANFMWDTVGTAQMQNNQLMYRGDSEEWVTYEQRWQSEDERRKEDWKKKHGDTKIKVSKDGDIKVKDESGKVKYDADDNKVKVDSSN